MRRSGGRFLTLAVMVLALLPWSQPAAAQFFDFFSFNNAPVPSERVRRKARPAQDAAAPRTQSAQKTEMSDRRPEGIVQIVVSIPDQRMHVYTGGERFASAPVSSGKPGHSTPKGVFSILQKRRFHRSNIYSGAPMPFMQRLTWSGVALHAGALPGYPASHGCIRLPHSFAESLFKVTSAGARVIVTDGLIAPVTITHANLPVYRAPALTDRRGQLAPLAMPGHSEAEALMAALRDGNGAGGDPIGALAQAAVEESAEEEADEPGPLERALLKQQPVTVFVSRRTGKVYVRQGYEPLFSADIEIRERDRPLGTHVLTVMERDAQGQGLVWNAMTLPAEPATRVQVADSRRRSPSDAAVVAAAAAAAEDVTAANALDRLVWPAELTELIGPLLMPGSSVLISDQGLGRETGKHTDFIVLTQ
ncbi:MAG: L,D-transpeptidase [Hyphomicrobiaceae bacterium]